LEFGAWDLGFTKKPIIKIGFLFVAPPIPTQNVVTTHGYRRSRDWGNTLINPKNKYFI
jgi:hypothetical protein